MTLLSPEPDKRHEATRAVCEENALPALEAAIKKETSPRTKQTLTEARAAIILNFGQRQRERKDRRCRGDTRARRSGRGGAFPLPAETPPSVARLAAAAAASITSDLGLWTAARNARYGISLGCVLLLAAIGLAHVRRHDVRPSTRIPRHLSLLVDGKATSRRSSSRARRADMKMSRAIIAVLCGPALACCSVNSNMPNLYIPSIDLFDPPATATVTIESNPPGAEARASSGGLCRTPCALSVPANEGFTVTYVLDGYLPQTVSVRSIPVEKSALIDMTPPRLEPNPVLAELQPAPPPPEPPPVKRRQRP
jgi:hypothetical protein